MKRIKRHHEIPNDIINNIKNLKHGKLNSQQQIILFILILFLFLIDNDKEHVMHSKSDNIKIMINDEADEAIKELFDLLKNK